MTHLKIAIFTCMLILSAPIVRAQPSLLGASAAHTTIRPWAKGVSEHEQSIALALYKSGNQEFVNSRFSQALAKYRKAIRHWDHPAIRFNMAVCLINLDQIVEAKDHLEHSLLYGVAALGARAHEQALTYKKLLDSQLVQLEVDCAEPGARVTLDGKLLFIGPGTMEQVVLPGEHQVVVTKDGYLTSSETFILAAGKSRTYEIRPLFNADYQVPCVADATQTSRPKYPPIPSLPDWSQRSSTIDNMATSNPPKTLPLAVSVPRGNGSSYSLIPIPSVANATTYQMPTQSNGDIYASSTGIPQIPTSILLISPTSTIPNYPFNSSTPPILNDYTGTLSRKTTASNYTSDASPITRSTSSYIPNRSSTTPFDLAYGQESSMLIFNTSPYATSGGNWTSASRGMTPYYGEPIAPSLTPGLQSYTPGIISTTPGYHSTIMIPGTGAPTMPGPTIINPVSPSPITPAPITSFRGG